MDKNTRIYVAGHHGLAGSAIWRHLRKAGFSDLVGFTSREVDLSNRESTFRMMSNARPDIVINAAALVGGIYANMNAPVDFLHQNLAIQLNITEAAHENGVGRLLFLGSSCIYPKYAAQPIEESSMLGGHLEETNIGYAIAKIAGVVDIQGYRKQYGHRWISAMPTNLYGPGDNYDPNSSHVLAALLRRFHNAKQDNSASVQVWGTGTPLREFLHTDDLASAVETLLENYDSPEPINIGSGDEVSISELAEIIAGVVGYKGSISFDASKPDGTPRKALNSDKLRTLGWAPRWSITDGIHDAYKAFLGGAGSA